VERMSSSVSAAAWPPIMAVWMPSPVSNSSTQLHYKCLSERNSGVHVQLVSAAACAPIQQPTAAAGAYKHRGKVPEWLRVSLVQVQAPSRKVGAVAAGGAATARRQCHMPTAANTHACGFNTQATSCTRCTDTCVASVIEAMQQY
jgi:hypothetical protein